MGTLFGLLILVIKFIIFAVGTMTIVRWISDRVSEIRKRNRS